MVCVRFVLFLRTSALQSTRKVKERNTSVRENRTLITHLISLQPLIGITPTSLQMNPTPHIDGKLSLHQQHQLAKSIKSSLANVDTSGNDQQQDDSEFIIFASASQSHRLLQFLHLHRTPLSRTTPTLHDTFSLQLSGAPRPRRPRPGQLPQPQHQQARQGTHHRRTSHPRSTHVHSPLVQCPPRRIRHRQGLSPRGSLSPAEESSGGSSPH